MSLTYERSYERLLKNFLDSYIKEGEIVDNAPGIWIPTKQTQVYAVKELEDCAGCKKFHNVLNWLGIKNCYVGLTMDLDLGHRLDMIQKRTNVKSKTIENILKDHSASEIALTQTVRALSSDESLFMRRFQEFWYLGILKYTEMGETGRLFLV